MSPTRRPKIVQRWSSYGSAFPTISKWPLGAGIIKLAKQRMPNVRIVLRQTNSFVAAQALNEKEIDLAITSGGIVDRPVEAHVARQLGLQDRL